jgi:hypothetical protein
VRNWRLLPNRRGRPPPSQGTRARRRRSQPKRYPPRRQADRAEGPSRQMAVPPASRPRAHTGDRSSEIRRLLRVQRADGGWPLPDRRSNHPDFPRPQDLRAEVGDRTLHHPRRAPFSRRGHRSTQFWLPLVRAVPLAISEAALPRADRLSIRTDFRPGLAPVLPGGDRQGANPPRLFDPLCPGRRTGGDRPFRRDVTILAHIRPGAHHQPHRRGTRTAPVPPSHPLAGLLFRNPAGGADRRARSRTGNDPGLPDRARPFLGA